MTPPACLRGGYCGRHVGTRSLAVARAGRPQFGIEHLKRRTVGLDLHSVGGARPLGSCILVISRAGRRRLRAPVCRVGHGVRDDTSGTFSPSPALWVAAPSRPVASAAREVREPCAETPSTRARRAPRAVRASRRPPVLTVVGSARIATS